MPIRNVELSEHSDHFIDEAVGAGKFPDASEAVGETLQLLEERERENEARTKWLEAAAKEGFDDLDRGDAIRFESMDELAVHICAIGTELRTGAGEPRVA